MVSAVFLSTKSSMNERSEKNRNNDNFPSFYGLNFITNEEKKTRNPNFCTEIGRLPIQAQVFDFKGIVCYCFFRKKHFIEEDR